LRILIVEQLPHSQKLQQSLGQMGSAQNADNDILQLPIIDVSNPTAETGREMINAAAKYGFLYIDTKGTGFTEDIVNREFDLSKQFFSSSAAEKQECLIDKTNKGWTGMHGELLDPKTQRKGDFKEAFNMGDFVNGKPTQPMPKSLTLHVDELADFNQRCKSLCHLILELFAQGLDIEDKNFFTSRHTEPSCTVRLLHYPAIPEEADYQPEVDIRAGAHSDYGSITLLFQRPSQPGLEIRTPSNTWAPVPVIPTGYTTSTTFPPILVNIGDLLSYWTNGFLKSTIHRVIFPKDARRGGEDRYSIAYFCHPNENTTLVPVPSKMIAERKMVDEVGYGGGATGERAMTAKEHLQNRLNATYDFNAVKRGIVGNTA
jgi:isopenicillin N synthase-like dioxygenase